MENYLFVLGGLLALSCLKVLIFGASFNFYYLIRYPKDYWIWYHDQYQSYRDYRACQKIEQEIHNMALKESLERMDKQKK